MTSSTPTLKTGRNGTRRWTFKGRPHRTDGPAIEYADGRKEWWANGKKHRVDDPAIEYADGGKEWWINGQLHRTDGPAVENADGYKAWLLNGKRHRTDGPAVEEADGYKAWFLNDKLHRIDGPALEYAYGTKAWYLNGELHRTDGAAFEGADGNSRWWVNGEEISPPHAYVLTAAVNRGLYIPEEAMSEMAKATCKAQTSGEQIGGLKATLNKHWPMHVKKILAALFMDSDPAIKHLAFSLLGREALQKGTSSVTAL